MFNIDKLRVLSLFSGIGSPETSLKRLGIKYDLIGFSEIDKYAIKSYCALHDVDESLNLGDVTKVNETKLNDFDILIGGFPCQAFSVAGHRKGFEDTRGTLFFELARIAKYKQPKYIILENVKGLVNHDKGNTLEVITKTISDIGYVFDFEVLNSKYFDIPQHRERIFIVCVREDLLEQERWIFDKGRNDVVSKGKQRISEIEGMKTFNFNWPLQQFVTKKLRDILEKEVDQKFYLSKDKTEKLIDQLNNNGKPNNEKDGCNMVGRLEMKGHDALKRVYDDEYISPTLTTMGGGNTEPKIVIEEIVCLNTYKKDGSQNSQQDRVYDTNGQMVALTSSLNGRFNIVENEVRATLTPDRVDKRQKGRRFKGNDEPAFTVNTQDKHGVAIGNYPTYSIRKLTPKECWRLMGFNDEEFEIAAKLNSNSQLYKQAGNSIVVDVLVHIFVNLLHKLNK